MSTTNKRSANTSRGNSNKSSRLNNDAEGEPRREERLRQSPPAEPSPVFLPQPLAGLAREAGEAFFNRPTVLERLTVSPGVEPLSRRGRGAEDLFRTQLEEWSRAPVGHDFLRLAYEQANNQLDLAATEDIRGSLERLYRDSGLWRDSIETLASGETVERLYRFSL